MTLAGKARRRAQRPAWLHACLIAVFLTASGRWVAAADAPAEAPIKPVLQVGDCVEFREGGSGWLLTTPVYWLRGSLTAIRSERRTPARCPRLERPPSTYTPAERALLARSLPCRADNARLAEIEVTRASVTVDAWETPWSHQHGTAGWLFRGQFLDQTLTRGGIVEMDAEWLTRCTAKE